MKLFAKFVKCLDLVSGTTDRGEWVRGGMVVRTMGDNERLVAITVFGEEKVAMCRSFKVDDILQVDFVPESREYGDKWFTDLRMIRVALLGSSPVENRKEADNG